MMPYHIRKRVDFLIRKMEKAYGDYATYTDLLDELHTLFINDAQSFKPKRKTRKKKDEETSDEPHNQALPEGDTSAVETEESRS